MVIVQCDIAENRAVHLPINELFLLYKYLLFKNVQFTKKSMYPHRMVKHPTILFNNVPSKVGKKHMQHPGAVCKCVALNICTT